MFNFPPKDGSLLQASSDENALVLHDNLEDFRALCWALYALPMELHEQDDYKTADLTKLIRLVSISNKYHFITLEKWAIDRITKHCSNITSNHFLHSCSQELFETMLSLAVTCHAYPLRKDIETAWLQRLKNDSSMLSEALNVASRLGLREFQGVAYYQQLVAVNSSASQSGIVSVPPKIKLTDAQMICLFTGSWSLTRHWNKIVPRNPPILERASDCNINSHSSCIHQWTQAWKHITENWGSSNSSQVFDPLEMLQTAKISCNARLGGNNQGNIFGLFEIITPSCRTLAVNKFGLLHQDIKDSLAEHFLGPKDVE
ncbi:hypothetical protein BDQ12DRAFT_737979 [Crucibulum laeve]|uniref:BTB domain-containing protein n=1 Tax=Crucibulum laeve TaxID=68775 RepID=A0A5C3M172_9AGAR|nr:hypothetical protein BDQ12DRAFT_737979 [Crucibulum laeve]